MSRCRLIYKSISSEPFMSNEALGELVRQSAENNQATKISGLLLLSGDRFLQVLEGPTKAVNHLFKDILLDLRHHDVTLVSFESIGPAYFEDWSMRLVDLDNLPLHPREFFMRKYEHKDGVIRYPEKLHAVYGLLLDAKVLCFPENNFDRPQETPVD